jgi:hypothetical protein
MQDLTSPSDLIALSWENFVAHIRSYSEFAVWVIAVGFVQFLVTTVLRSIIDDKAVFLAMYFLTTLPISLVIAVVAGGLIDFTANAVRKKQVDVRRSLGVGVHHLISLLWISLLSFLAVLGGAFLLIIPMFIFYVWFKFAKYALFVDGIRGIGAMQASKALTSGQWWPVTWRIAIPTVFFGVAGYFFALVLYLVIGSLAGDPRMFFGTPVSIWNVSTTQLLVTTVVPQLIGAFTAALILGSETILYFDLRKAS